VGKIALLKGGKKKFCGKRKIPKRGKSRGISSGWGGPNRKTPPS